MRDLYQIFVHVAYVHGSALLRLVDDRPHRLSAGRGDGTTQRGRSVIYDCLAIDLQMYRMSALLSLLRLISRRPIKSMVTSGKRKCK